MSFTSLCGFLIEVWSITLLLENLFEVLWFSEGAWSDTFFFFQLIIRCPLCTTQGLGASVAPQIPWRSWALSLDTSLVFPGLHSVSFIGFVFFAGGSSSSYLGVLRHDFLAYPWCSFAHFLSTFRALPGRISLMSFSRGGRLSRKSLIALLTNLSLVLKPSRVWYIP